MPYTAKERKLYAGLVKQYGAKKAKQVYHAMINSKKHEKNFGAKTKKRRVAKARHKSKKRGKR